jgi:hypothetical protein
MKEVPHAKVMEVVTMITPPDSRFYTKSLELIPDGAKHSRIDSLPVVPTAKTGNASTGFAAYVYFSQKYPDAHIYLLGWTFHHDQPEQMCHDFHAEKRAIMEAVECGNVFITS